MSANPAALLPRRRTLRDASARSSASAGLAVAMARDEAWPLAEVVRRLFRATLAEGPR